MACPSNPGISGWSTSARQHPNNLIYFSQSFLRLYDMAKQGYPGLVQVPPSDRWLFRRRLMRWSFVLIAVIWGASAITAWRAPSDRNTDCQVETGVELAPALQEKCGPPSQSVAAAPVTPPQSPPSVTEASPAARAREPQSPKSPPAPIAKRSTAPPSITHVAKATPAKRSATPPSPANSPIVPPVPPPAPPQEYASAAKPAAESPSPSSHPDVRLAEQGDAFAQYRLGRFYAKQDGLEAQESVHWYRKAFDGLRRLAEDGNGEAMHVLGVMYAFGRGVPKDKNQARHWLTRATEHEVPAARHVLVSLESRPTPARNPHAFVSH